MRGTGCNIQRFSPDVPPETSPDILQTVIVEIIGSETLITDVENAASVTLTANVNGIYSSGLERNLAPVEYNLEWSTSNTDIEGTGLSFSSGQNSNSYGTKCCA